MPRVTVEIIKFFNIFSYFRRSAYYHPPAQHIHSTGECEPPRSPWCKGDRYGLVQRQFSTDVVSREHDLAPALVLGSPYERDRRTDSFFQRESGRTVTTFGKNNRNALRLRASPSTRLPVHGGGGDGGDNNNQYRCYFVAAVDFRAEVFSFIHG